MAITSTLPNAANPLAGLGAGPSTAAAGADTETGDRFLKLLVAQMQNQDPLNPMDNAQVTTQMAQINTVNGIETLNRTVTGLNAQFVQMQALQGASLVGKDVTIAGDRLSVDQGVGEGAFEIATPADQVRVEILGPAGHVLGTVDLGARSAGRHRFEWPAGENANTDGLRFRVAARSGAAAVAATPLMTDRVTAVSAGGDTITLETLRSGLLPWSAVKTFN